ncbi:hypothetical protein [Candidatus Chlorohelix sp.]|uniref:GHMP family kinase ATP-binding protein n=1 Tax=Candidatus Chlorohelix sp. TaxID=3139201 RepID=UPI003041B34D
MPAYYEQFGGLVVSTSINKYFYVMINEIGLGDSQIISANYQSVFSVVHHYNIPHDLIWEDDLTLPKAVLTQFGVKEGENIFLASEVPPATGLGSSSATTVGLLTGLSRKRNQNMSKIQVAEMACHIELEMLKMPIGKQNQYASALGGLNLLEFNAIDVRPIPIKISSAGKKALQNNLMLFFLGVSSKSTTILREQFTSIIREDKQVLENLHHIKELAFETKKCLECEDFDTFGELLDEGWQRKKNLSPNIANTNINKVYKTALDAGAIGGKITGAGGGGFLLLYCRPAKQATVISAMQAYGLKKMNFQFEEYGAHVLLDQRN